MLYLAVVQAVALVVALALVGGLVRALRAQSRSHARREDALLDKLLHTVGKPWTPSPSETYAWSNHATEPEPTSWTPSPEQLPA